MISLNEGNVMKEFSVEVFGPGDLGAKQSGTVTVSGDGLTVVPRNGPRICIGFSGLDLSLGGYDDLTIVIVGKDSQGYEVALHIRDHGFYDVLNLSAPGDLRSMLDKIRVEETTTRAAWRTRAAALGITLFCLYFFFVWIAGLAVGFVSPEYESSLGASIAESLKSRGHVVFSGAGFEKVQRVWERVSKGITDSPYKFNVTLVDTAEINALAAPGGHIVVFTGLLEKTQSPEELAGILAHEVAHCLKRHGLKRIAKSLSVGALVTILIGDPGGIGRVVRDFGANMISLSYSRSDEREADQQAVEILVKAGIDPSKFPEFFRRMGTESIDSGLLSVISSHPSYSERYSNIQGQLQKYAENPFPKLPIPWK